MVRSRPAAMVSELAEPAGQQFRLGGGVIDHHQYRVVPAPGRHRLLGAKPCEFVPHGKTSKPILPAREAAEFQRQPRFAPATAANNHLNRHGTRCLQPGDKVRHYLVTAMHRQAARERTEYRDLFQTGFGVATRMDSFRRQ
ncbi:MAG TPA: hypothetical protein VMB73_29530 [Acetobacteraceae bacterium]|nr:hypothetical protein [Acetobacteraceae bacterium]